MQHQNEKVQSSFFEKEKITSKEFKDFMKAYIKNNYDKYIYGDHANLAEIFNHKNLVIPAYLIELKGNKSINRKVEDTLMVQKIRASLECEKYSNALVENNDKITTNATTMNRLLCELQKEIGANQVAELESIKLKFDYKITSTIQQLSFKLDNLFETTENKSNKYKREALQKQNDDYQFVMSSIRNQRPAIVEKVLHVFKIQPVDQNEIRRMKGSRLYLHGIKSNEVESVLKNGYHDQMWSFNQVCMDDCVQCKSEKCALYMSDCVDVEITKGVSCSHDEYRKFSFVYVVSGQDSLQSNKHNKVVSDSRGNHVKNGHFKTLGCRGIDSRSTIGMIPAYLIVLKL